MSTTQEPSRVPQSFIPIASPIMPHSRGSGNASQWEGRMVGATYTDDPNHESPVFWLSSLAADLSLHVYDTSQPAPNGVEMITAVVGTDVKDIRKMDPFKVALDVLIQRLDDKKRMNDPQKPPLSLSPPNGQMQLSGTDFGNYKSQGTVASSSSNGAAPSFKSTSPLPPVPSLPLSLSRCDADQTLDDPCSTLVALYEYADPSSGTTYWFLSTRGTANGEDWVHNALQSIGISDHYAEIAKFARQIQHLAEIEANHQLIFTGHSKGGGHAALNSMVTGCYAITFNAAGVSDLTRESVGREVWGDNWAQMMYSDSHIYAFWSQYDPLVNISKYLGTSYLFGTGDRIGRGVTELLGIKPNVLDLEGDLNGQDGLGEMNGINGLNGANRLENEGLSGLSIGESPSGIAGRLGANFQTGVSLGSLSGSPAGIPAGIGGNVDERARLAGCLLAKTSAISMTEGIGAGLKSHHSSNWEGGQETGSGQSGQNDQSGQSGGWGSQQQGGYQHSHFQTTRHRTSRPRSAIDVGMSHGAQEISHGPKVGGMGGVGGSGGSGLVQRKLQLAPSAPETPHSLPLGQSSTPYHQPLTNNSSTSGAGAGDVIPRRFVFDILTILYTIITSFLFSVGNIAYEAGKTVAIETITPRRIDMIRLVCGLVQQRLKVKVPPADGHYRFTIVHREDDTLLLRTTMNALQRWYNGQSTKAELAMETIQTVIDQHSMQMMLAKMKCAFEYYQRTQKLHVFSAVTKVKVDYPADEPEAILVRQLD